MLCHASAKHFVMDMVFVGAEYGFAMHQPNQAYPYDIEQWYDD